MLQIVYFTTAHSFINYRTYKYRSIESKTMINILNIILDVIAIVFASIGVLTLIGIAFLLIYYRRECPINTPIFLICNNYFGIMLCCLFTLFKLGCNLYGDLYDNVNLDNWWCYASAYGTSVAYYLLYHSYIIQACYRLFHVVFYKNKKLYSFQFMCILIVLQWSLDCIITIPTWLLNHYEYVPNNYYCTTTYLHFNTIAYIGILEYYVPMFSVIAIYFCMIHYMKKKKSTTIQQGRHQENQRDLLVVRRIMILVGVLIALSFPSTVFYFWYVFTGYLYPQVYQLQWITISFVLAILPSVTVFLTPQLRELVGRRFKKDNHVHPVPAITKK